MAREKEPRVQVLICCRNNSKIISDCLDAIKKQDYKNLFCVVVDDNSNDNTGELVKKQYKWVKYIYLEKWSGPSLARNIGIDSFSSDYIVIIDSDVILRKDWIKVMVDFMEKNPNVAITGGKTLLGWNHSLIDSVGGKLPPYLIGQDRGREESAKLYNKDKKVIFVGSSDIIVRRSVINKIGKFDAEHGYGSEDLDICWRANIAGYDVMYYHKAIAIHNVGTTQKTFGNYRSLFFNRRGWLLAVFKNLETKSILKYLPIMLFVPLHDFIFKLRFNIKELLRPYIAVYKLRDHIREERKRISGLRKRSDKELISLFR